jgi:hypothetical protein
MAGDWIKVEVTTPTKHQVLNVADRLGIAPAHALGLFIKLWCWFDQHTEDGHADVRNLSTIDAHVGHEGFCDAVAAEGWLISDDGVTLPHFDEHNGVTAKRRAKDALRKRMSREGAGTTRTKRGRGADKKKTTAGPRERDIDIPPKSPTGDLVETQIVTEDNAIACWIEYRATLGRPLNEKSIQDMIAHRERIGARLFADRVRFSRREGLFAITDRIPDEAKTPGPRVECESAGAAEQIADLRAHEAKVLRERAERDAWFAGLSVDDRVRWEREVEARFDSDPLCGRCRGDTVRSSIAWRRAMYYVAAAKGAPVHATRGTGTSAPPEAPEGLKIDVGDSERRKTCQQDSAQR